MPAELASRFWRFWSKAHNTCRTEPNRPTRYRLTFEQLEDRTVPAGTSFADATLIQPNDLVNDAIASAAEVDFYQVDIVETGRLTVAATSGKPAS